MRRNLNSDASRKTRDALQFLAYPMSFFPHSKKNVRNRPCVKIGCFFLINVLSNNSYDISLQQNQYTSAFHKALLSKILTTQRDLFPFSRRQMLPGEQQNLSTMIKSKRTFLMALALSCLSAMASNEGVTFLFSNGKQASFAFTSKPVITYSGSGRTVTSTDAAFLLRGRYHGGH